MSVTTVARFIRTPWIGAARAFADASTADFLEKLLINKTDSPRVGAQHLEQSVLDVRQGRQIAQVYGMEVDATDCVGHDPADQVAQEQMRVNLLDDTGGRMRTEVLDVQAVLPFSIDGLDLPTAMVEIDEFGVEMNLLIEERSEEPTRAEARPLVTEQACDKNLGQIGVFSACSRRRTEFDDPFVVREGSATLGITRLLIGEPNEKVCSA